MPNRIKVVVCKDASAAAFEAANLIASVVRERTAPVIGLATGSTPEKVYAELARKHREEKLSFSHLTTFNLDEYVGLASTHPQSYRTFMQTHLFAHLDVLPWRTHVLDGTAILPAFECEAFEKRILAAGGVDLWLLGIGGNGHIAFNEPGSPIDSRTRIVALTPDTIAANSDGRFFSDPADVPRTALTAGIATIREARRVVLLATGAKKSAAVAAALSGPFTEACPASLLQDHIDCTFVLDEAAASAL